jgi:DNA-binding CsgD family transcriptional regulator
MFTEGYPAALPIAGRALQAFRSEDIAGDGGMRWLWLASIAAAAVWDDESWYALSARHLKMARESGALSELPLALNSRVVATVFAGELPVAAALVEEADAVTETIGSGLAPYGALGLAGWRGREGEALELIGAVIEAATVRGEGRAIDFADYSTAVLYNGLARYEDARAAAQRASSYEGLCLFGWELVELVEAAVRSGDREVAADALRRLEERTGAAGTNWALAILARSRALLSAGEEADSLYREAIERLARTRVAGHLARARLLYGEWLRRENRRVDAREQLRAAHEMFSRMGAEAFAERARRELAATGETVRKRTVDTLDELTTQEAQVAGLARDGHSNTEIGAQLFISPRTVEYHLHKVFTKLGISSRKELRAALAEAQHHPLPG